MQQYQNVLQDKFGNVIVGASVAVYVYGTTTPATIYSGNGTGLLPSNTVTTSSLGEFAFYAANGRYSLSITATNFVAESYSDFILYDPADIGAVTASSVAFTPFGTIAATNVQNAIQEVVTDLSASSGSSLVGFLQSGTGAVARTVQAKERDVVSVKDFGAVGDGTTDDTAAIQAAFNYSIPIGSKLKFPTGTYVVATSLSNISGGEIDIEFDVGAVIDGSTSTAATLITLGGTLGTGISLSSDAAKGATSLTVTGNSFAAGDIILIQSTALWNPTRPEYYKGEMARVDAVSGSTVYVDTALYDSYTAATTTVFKYNMAQCRINGMKVIRASNQAGLTVQYVRDYELKNVDVRNANERNIYLLQCFNGSVINCNTYGHYYVGTGTAYGLCIASCQQLLVEGGYFSGGRHGITTGGTFPVRAIKFNSVNVDNDGASATYSFDTHGNGEFIELNNCHVHNGAGLQTINTRIDGGEYRAGEWTGGAISLIPEVSGKYLQIQNVYAENFAAKTAIDVRLYTDALTFDYVSIVGNTARTLNPSGGGLAGIIVVDIGGTATTGTIKNIVISGNDVDFPSSPSVARYALAVGVNYSIAADINLSENTFRCAYNNTRSVYIRITGTVKSSRNTYIGGGAADYSGVVASGDFYSSNDTFDGLSAALYFYISTTGKVSLSDCITKNMTSNGGLLVSAATDVMLRNVDKTNSTGSFSISATYAYSDKSNAGTKTLYRSSVPSAYTWAVGDRCINSAPSVGNPKSWVCTVAGTPGTWTSEGNL